MQVDLGRVEAAAWDLHLPQLMSVVYFWITKMLDHQDACLQGECHTS